MALNEYVRKGEFDRRVKLIEEKIKHIDVKFDTRDLEARLEKENQYYVDQLIDDVSSQIVSAETIANEIDAALQEAKEFTTESIENIPDPTTYDGTDIKAMVNYFVNSYNNFAANTLRFNSVFDTDGQFIGKIRPSSIETGALFVGQRSQQLSLSGIEFRVLPYIENSTQGSENYGYLEIVNSEHSKYHFINNNKLQYKTETAIDKGIAGFMLHYGFGTDTKPKVYVIYEQNIQLQTAATGDDDESGFYIYAKIKSSNREYKSISVDSTKFGEEYNNLYVYENSTYKRVAGKKYNAGTTYYKKNPAFGTSPVDLTGTVSEYLTISVTEDIYINDYSSLYTKQNGSYVLETRTAYNSSTTYYIKEEEAYVLNTATTTYEAEIGAAGSSSSNFIATILVSQNQYAYDYDISNGFLTIKLGYISIATTTPREVVPQTDPVSYYKQRKVDMTYGSTTIDGRLITTGRIEGSGAYFDLDTGQIGGNIQFSTNDKTNIIGFIPQTIKEVRYKAAVKSNDGPSTSGIIISDNEIDYDGWGTSASPDTTNNCIYSVIITYTNTGGVLSNLSKSSVTLIKEFIDLSPYAETNDISYPIEEVVYIAIDIIEKPTLNISGSNNKITYTVSSTTITVEAPDENSIVETYNQNTPDSEHNYNTGWTLAMPTSGRWYYKCIQKYDKKQSDGSKINFSVSKIEYDAAASAIAICYAGTTEISGGLVVTNAMMLKKDSGDEDPVNGGISGVEAFPAFWAGGDEEEAGNVASIRDLYPDENERYDHYSNANIPNVFIDFDGFAKFGDAYVYGDKFNWSINTNELIIGNCKLVWDNDAGMLKFMIGDKSTSSGYYSGTTRWSTFNGIYSTNAISALGANDQQGGGGGGLDVGTMWEYLNGNSTYSGSETTTILGEFLSSNNAGGFLKYSGSGYASWSSIGIGDITSLQNELNGKQSKLPISGSASSTYAINISGASSKLGTSNIGSATKPIYLSSGTATACTYSLSSDVNSGTTGYLAYYGSGTLIKAAGTTDGLKIGNQNLFFNAGGDGIYINKNGISYHDTNNTFKKTSIYFKKMDDNYTNVYVGINNSSPNWQLDVSGDVRVSSSIIIGSASDGAKISWNSDNGGLKIEHVVSGSTAGIYADWVSALGANSSGGGGGGDINWADFWNELNGTYDPPHYSGSTIIDIDYLPINKSTNSFYAPITSGTSGYFLKSNGTNSAPTWQQIYSWALQSTKPSYTKSEVGLSNVTNDAQIAKSVFSGAYQIMYSTAASTPAILSPNTNGVKRFLSMKGTGSAGAAPSWSDITNDDLPAIRLGESDVSGTLPITKGGTGATTAANVRSNLNVCALISDSYPTIMPYDGSTNNWIKIGTANTSYGLLPSQSGGAGNGHNYIGATGWYWKYAYIDQIYGYLNGSISGNAATATKLGTSSVGNAIKPFFLNAGVPTVCDIYRYHYDDTSDFASYAWHKVAYGVAGELVDRVITFLVTKGNTTTINGILKCRSRFDANSVLDSYNTGLTWIINNGIDVNNFVFVWKSPNIELWCKTTEQWGGYQFTVLDSGNRSMNGSLAWDLCDSINGHGSASYTSGGTVITSTNATLTNNINGTVNGYSISSTVNGGTANRLAYYSSSGIDDASTIYASNTKLAINSTTEPSYNFYVNGTSYLNGTTYNNGNLFLSPGSTGIYLNGTGISWHNASNTYVAKQMTFDGTNVGIGTTSPAYKLDINGNVHTNSDFYLDNTKKIYIGNNEGTTVYKDAMRLDSGNAFIIGSGTSASSYNTYLDGFKIYLRTNTNHSTRLYIDESGNVGIGNTSPDTKLHVSGNIYATGGVTALQAVSSDRRLKKNIKKFNAKDIIDKLNPVSFEWNSKAKKLSGFQDGKNYGLIAQDSDNIIDNFVFDLPDGNGYKGVRYEKLIPILLQAVKEQQKEINELKKLVRK